MLVLYSNKLLKDWQAGCRVLCNIVVIRPEHRDNEGLHVHEEEHCKQWEKRPFSHDLRYWFSKKYRLACEAIAYKKQIAFSKNLKGAADSLSKYYRLDISLKEAEEAILQAESV